MWKQKLYQLIAFMSRSSPFVKKTLWLRWYNRLAKRIDSTRWTFMNYGLAWPQEPGAPTLQPDDEPDRSCAQLYHRVTSTVSLANKDVLEVGSGRGGGAAFLARYHNPARLVGVDFSRRSVAFCKTRHVLPNLSFQKADAESLPFKDSTFDVVVNVESSHCYGSVERFFSEAVRVLRPGGHFLFADLREAAEMPQLEAWVTGQPGWKVTEREDITASVAAALLADDARKRALIDELVPAEQRAGFGEFAGLAGSRIQLGLSNRSIQYVRFVAQKT